jgi:DNA replication and repair protein RecF
VKLAGLELFQYRNHGQVKFAFDAPLQFFVGANALGKTNLVESIYVLATGRSFRRTAQTRDLVMHGCDEAAVRGEVLRGGFQTRLEVRLGKSRRLTVNGNEVHLLRDYVRHLSVVAFHPEDLMIVRGGPDVRRDFVDRAAFTLFPEYLDEYSRYQRALAERNQLLKHGAAPGELEAWTEELAVTGAGLATARMKYLGQFLPAAKEAFEEIFGPVGLELAYDPSPKALLEEPVEVWREVMLRALKDREADDRFRGFTTVGPHRDDLKIELGGKEARVYASQGQTRALALAFRVAQIRHAEGVLGSAPLFILDDVGSELDETRRGFLADFLAASPVQAFITATDRNLLPPLEDKGQTWRLEEGGGISEA